MLQNVATWCIQSSPYIMMARPAPVSNMGGGGNCGMFGDSTTIDKGYPLAN